MACPGPPSSADTDEKKALKWVKKEPLPQAPLHPKTNPLRPQEKAAAFKAVAAQEQRYATLAQEHERRHLARVLGLNHRDI